MAGIMLLSVVGLNIDLDCLVPHCVMGSRDQWEFPSFSDPSDSPFACYAGFTLAPRSPRSPRSRKIVELHDFVFLPRFRTLPYASNKFCHDLWRFITNPTRLWSRSTTNFSTIRQAFSRSSRWTLAFSHVLLRSLETCHVCYVLLRSATIMETIQRGSPRLSHDWHIKRT